MQLAQRVVALGLVALGICNVVGMRMRILSGLYPIKNARVNAPIDCIVHGAQHIKRQKPKAHAESRGSSIKCGTEEGVCPHLLNKST